MGTAVGIGLGLALLLAPASDGMPEAAWRVTAVLALMAMWWITEAIPIAATALVPLVLFPVLDVAPMRATATPYADPLVFLMFGGFLLALGMQRCGLHRRIALAILRAAGRRPDLLVGGFMVATAGLSMWISNTATAAMMLPIGLSVLALVSGRPPEAMAGDRDGDGNLAIALLLGIAFAANIGGMGTLIGTPPNAVLAGFMAETYDRDISFVRWMLVGVPVAATMLVIVWAALTRVVFPVGTAELSGVGTLIDRERDGLGPLTAAEGRFAVVFATTGLAWLFRPLLDGAAPGVAVSDTGIAIAAGLALFLTPEGPGRGRPLLDWDATRELPWRVLLLIGGGLSLGAAIEDTGLAAWVGEALSGFAGGWPFPAIVAAVAATALLTSHVMSNTAAAATLVPLFAALALRLDATPLQLAAPAVLAASCAFMLPVATPPNAIVHGSGLVSTAEMARSGALLSVAAVAVSLAAAYLLVAPVFG